MRKLTRRFVVESTEGLNLSSPLPYERYYIKDKTRIQNRGGQYEKEVLDENGEIIVKSVLSKEEYENLKKQSDKVVARKSYLFLDDNRVSIKEYLGDYAGLIRAEVEFRNAEEQKSFRPYSWMIKEITDSPLAFDSLLHKLSKHEFDEELTGVKNGSRDKTI